MSLRNFHILFIACSSLSALFFGLWSMNYSAYYQKPGYWTAGFVSVVFAVLLLVYGWIFSRKLRDS